MSLQQGWKNTMDAGVTDATWDAYDAAIQREIAAYNLKFQSTTGYRAVDWHLCKAMVWIESGGPSSSAWTGKAMQIGVSGDPGLGVLQSGADGSTLIMSATLAAAVKNTAQVGSDPVLNIQAGIAYLFTRMCLSEFRSVDTENPPRVYDYTVVPGDNPSLIAKKVGTTVEVLEALNPAAKRMIHPKDVLKYRKASIQRVITGWRDFTSMTVVADRYNGGGDPDYAAKLVYVLALFTKINRTPPKTP
ncbi:MAG: LysM domain-containing protein [Candidatus Sulfotelmatobacter sp.]|jgi:LysM repeat protein